MSCSSIAEGVVRLKREFMKQHQFNGNCMLETVPQSYSEIVPISNHTLLQLINYLSLNPIYVESKDTHVLDLLCRFYLCDLNEYWLSSKKYDSSYQPFYPTWMLSAYALALCAKSLGFEEIVDVGSGDGRIAYCGSLLGLRSIGLEIDSNLTELQSKLSLMTKVNYEIVNADATVFEYESLHLTKPVVFLSGLPEWGDMLAKSVIPRIKALDGMESCGFNLMGSHIMKKYSRDFAGWGWGGIFETYDLVIQECVTLPTYWTNDQKLDTAYIFTKSD
ncbi:hypothetical protein [Nitrososphaera sp. AFS]|uniref:hypothetical protein n=1 Tax=Nitrososphaera sp. AFS TaxID=2301191 RepID=UPI0013923BA5|nr:hypothetical protein [Nitrososphaera sp. AFS]NAL76794.1 hypothetical protein [Nitrososphaera sp. AFS]